MLWSHDDEALQLVDRLGAADKNSLPRHENLTQGLPQSAGAGGRLLFTGEHRPNSLNRVDAIAFGTSRSANSGDLDDVLARLGEHSREPGGQAAGALERPDPPSWSLLATPVQQARVARPIGAIGPVRADAPGAAGDDRQIDGVFVRVTADAEHVNLDEAPFSRIY